MHIIRYLFACLLMLLLPLQAVASVINPMRGCADMTQAIDQAMVDCEHGADMSPPSSPIADDNSLGDKQTHGSGYCCVGAACVMASSVAITPNVLRPPAPENLSSFNVFASAYYKSFISESPQRPPSILS